VQANGDEGLSPKRTGKKKVKQVEHAVTGLVYSDSVVAMEGLESGTGDGMGPPGEIDSHEFMDTVVKVYATHCSPNFSLPWSRKRQYSSTSTGFAIGGKRLLTNAHSVECHTQVRTWHRGAQPYEGKGAQTLTSRQRFPLGSWHHEASRSAQPCITVAVSHQLSMPIPPPIPPSSRLPGEPPHTVCERCLCR
jgi:hypothetical protein